MLVAISPLAFFQNCGAGFQTPTGQAPKVLDSSHVVTIIPLNNKLVLDNSYSCSITADDVVACRGENGYGGLGDGTTLTSIADILVPNTKGATHLSTNTNDNRTCAVVSGGVKCWGRAADKMKATLDTFTDVIATAQPWFTGQVFILKADGTVFGGTINSGDEPLPKLALPPIVQLSGNGDMGCLLNANGGVHCIGGQSGFAFPRTTKLSDLVPGFEKDFVQIAAGWSTLCGITKAGLVKCVGRNTSGELGNGSVVNSSLPITVPTADYAVSIVALNSSICVLLENKNVQCWGDILNHTTSGKTLGAPSRMSPFTITELAGSEKIVSSAYGICALNASGVNRCIGATPLSLGLPTPILSAKYEVDVFRVQRFQSCLVEKNGKGKFWSEKLLTYEPAGGVRDCSISYQSGCFLTNSGAVNCWQGAYRPDKDGNQVFSSPFNTTPRIATGAVQLSPHSNSLNGCATDANNDVECWLKNGDVRNKFVDVIPDNTSDEGVRCVAQRNGSKTCWSHFSNVFTNQTTTTTNLDFTGAKETVLWKAGGCVLDSSGTVKCWGSNSVGQLGNGTLTPSATMAPVTLGAKAISISGAVGDGTDAPDSVSVCALLETGRVKCWGSNAFGQLSYENRQQGANPSPVELTTVVNAASDLRITSYGGCVIDANGKSNCWGKYPFSEFESVVVSAPNL